MQPLLSAGQIVVVRKRKKIQVGSLVVFRHEGKEKIKKIRKLDSDKMYVEGLHQHSTDSSTFGWVSTDTIIGTLVWPSLKKELKIDSRR